MLYSSVGNMFRVERSNKGKLSIIDRHYFKYVANGESMSTARWRCSKRDCKATLQTTKSFSSLIGVSLPDHNHINNLLKRDNKDKKDQILGRWLHWTDVKNGLRTIDCKWNYEQLIIFKFFLLRSIFVSLSYKYTNVYHLVYKSLPIHTYCIILDA